MEKKKNKKQSSLNNISANFYDSDVDSFGKEIFKNNLSKNESEKKLLNKKKGFFKLFNIM